MALLMDKGVSEELIRASGIDLAGYKAHLLEQEGYTPTPDGWGYIRRNANEFCYQFSTPAQPREEAEKLLALPDDQYADLLARMAVRAAKTGREEIILNAKDRERVGAQVAAKANALLAEAAAPEAAGKAAKAGGKAGNLLSKVVTGASALLQGTAMLTLAQETRDMEGGLTLRGGSVEVNCAFETELRVLREEMAAEIAAILFA